MQYQRCSSLQRMIVNSVLVIKTPIA